MEAFWTGLRGKVGFSDLRNSLEGEPTQGGLRNIAALQPGNRRVTFNDTLLRNPDKFN